MVLKKKKRDEKKRNKPTFKGILTSVFATVAAIFLLLLAGLSLSGTAAVFIATFPLFVVFSPILVPAGITTGLIVTGLAASGGSGASGLEMLKKLKPIIMKIIKLLKGKMPPPGGGSAGASPGGSAGASPAAKPAAKPKTWI